MQQEQEKTIIDKERIVRDIKDGIVTIGSDGTILQLNPAAAGLLGLDGDFAGLKYADLMASDPNKDNDAFHQMIVDCVSGPDDLHKKTVSYTRNDGSKSMIEVKSAALTDTESGQISGVILSLTDRSLELSLKRKIEESVLFFTVMLCTICVWTFVSEGWKALGEPVSAAVLSKAMVLGMFVILVLARRKLHFSLTDAGLTFKGAKKTIITDCIVTLVLVILLALLKLVIMRFVPGFFDPSKPFVIWDKYPVLEYVTYAVSVLLQEIEARGFVHESLRRVLPEKHVNLLSIVVSSLIFGALHIHNGIVYMISAVLMMGLMGVVYNRQHNIWGLSIIHYVLGMAFGLLDFVVY